MVQGNIHRPGSRYANSSWRDEYSGLWDTGPRDTVALLTSHAGGTLGSTTISATTPGGGGRNWLRLWRTPGIERLPAAEHEAAAIGLAIDELPARAAAGPGAPAHEAYLHLGALITHLLADAAGHRR